MMMKNKLRLVLAFLTLLLPGALKSQVLVESVAGIVGNEVIYLSDIENAVADMRRSGNKTSPEAMSCNIFHDMLVQKLFTDQARIDSITVTDDAIEADLNMRLNDFIRKAGSEEALVAYFKKSMIEIKRDVKKGLLEQETVREVQNNIAKDISITPAALKKYYASISKDSLPVVPAKYQLSLIQLDPPSNEENKAEARQRLLDLRSRILKGESFSVLARLYSEDTESAKNGGEIGYVTRGEVEKEYANAAFSLLTKNTVSKIVETKFGYHLIQLIDKKGDMVNTRHILVRPKVKPDQAAKATAKLDSIADMIRKDSITFEKAAMRYSTHKDSRTNGGKMVSTDQSRVTWFTLEELSPEMYVRIRDMKVGEISEPFKTTDENNNEVFRIIKLDNVLPAHKANLKDDYQSLYDAALMQERSKVFDKWVKEKIKNTYIRISEEFKSCEFLKEGWLK
jgi:peptidyl-prolyl cis-trans isomerase SurA